MKSREWDKKAAQIFEFGASGLAREQGASENQKDAAKLTQSKTDSSSYFVIVQFLAFWQDIPLMTAKVASIVLWVLSIFACPRQSSAAPPALTDFDSNLESECLSNIEQVTFPAMGFEKAGEAYFSPDGQSLIFQAVAHGESEYQIYTMDLRKRTPLQVSTGKGACTCGFYRPDGKKIIFASSHESPLVHAPQQPSGKYVWDLTPYMNIYEADLDGSSLSPLTSGSAYHAECGYSSDGASIVFASNEDGTMNLYSCNADGTGKNQLTFSRGCYNGGPFFSPNGEWIVFRSDREKKDYLQIYMIRSDGSEEVQLTRNDAVNWAPFWHPNGKVIAYTTSKHGHRAYELYLLQIETLQEHRLTHNPSFDGLPSFSSDGKKIAWTSKRGDGSSQIFIADFTLPFCMR